MIVCICRRVSDKTIRACVEAGAQTVDQVTSACRAGSGCGACHEVIEDLIAEHQNCPRMHLKVVSPYLQAAGENA